jgi:hypothetical protein
LQPRARRRLPGAPPVFGNDMVAAVAAENPDRAGARQWRKVAQMRHLRIAFIAAAARNRFFSGCHSIEASGGAFAQAPPCEGGFDLSSGNRNGSAVSPAQHRRCSFHVTAFWTPHCRQAVASLKIPGLSDLFSFQEILSPVGRWVCCQRLFSRLTRPRPAADHFSSRRADRPGRIVPTDSDNSSCPAPDSNPASRPPARRRSHRSHRRPPRRQPHHWHGQ